MFTKQTVVVLTVISFIVSITIWNMSVKQNERARGEVIAKMITECESNIQFLETGRHNPDAKDEVDDALREITAGGHQAIEVNWLRVLDENREGIFIKSDSVREKVKALLTEVDYYNSKLMASAYDDYGDYGEDDYRMPKAPSKEHMVSGFKSMISALKQAGEQKNNFDF